MNTAREPLGSLEVALGHAERLLAKDPNLAAEQATEILNAVPSHPRARLILGAAHRLAGRFGPALEVLEPLVREQPRSVPALLELALAQSQAGGVGDALVTLRRALALNPKSVDGWRLLADTLDLLGDADGADRARARYLETANRDPRLMEAAAALVANQLPRADLSLRRHLASFPTDVAALRMRAEVAARMRLYREAEGLLHRCLELAPSFDAARHNYASVLNRQGMALLALPEVDRLLAKAPLDPGYRNLKAAILANLGDFDGAIGLYAAVLGEYPLQPKVWMSYGHALKTAGRRDESVAAYRRAIDMEPRLGEAYWSLANLKTFRFSTADRAAMHRALDRSDLSADDRLHFEFALGKAYEDQRSYAVSFRHYASGNALRRQQHPYSAEENSAFVRASKAAFTADFFRERQGFGADSPAPVFIVGLPRAGSTLLEQILASHSQIEGTMELPNIPRIAGELAGVGRSDASDPGCFAAAVAGLTAQDCQSLGLRYVSETRPQRKTGAPYFVDKMPNNWLYVGLIHLLLPNAKIIDVRRHPLGCGFSVFKQHFARGQNFAYGLDDIGHYYADYVELMAHLDAALPGRVHRVHYEDLVLHTEREIHRLLNYCGLPFEERCLHFHENSRAVRTASSEQVRQPIFRTGMDQWRHYEQWLEPLKAALGPRLGNCADGPAETMD